MTKLTYHTPLYFLLMSGLFQIVGLGLGLVFRQSLLGVVPSSALLQAAPWPAIVGLFIHAGSAYLMATWFKLPISWRVCNLLLAPSALLSIELNFAPEYLFIPLIFVAAVFAPTFWTRVPFYPTGVNSYEKIAELLPAGRPFRMIDLGSGFGGLLLFLSMRYPQGHFEGVEISPLPLFASKLKAFLSQASSVRFYYANLWKIPLVDYDVVYAFLSPAPMERLWGKVKGEMKSGTLFISNSFPVMDDPTSTVEVVERSGKRTTLYIYTVP